MLVVLNRLCRFKASGHACSTTAPLVLLGLCYGWVVLPACALLIAAVYSSSLRLERHTLPQLIVGSLVSILAATASIAIFIGL